MITCPKCGYQAPDGTPYCPRCGYGKQQEPISNIIRNPNTIQSQPNNQREKDAKTDKKEIIIAILAILLIILISLSLYFSLTNKKEKELNLHYYETITAQDEIIENLQQTATVISDMVYSETTKESESAEQQEDKRSRSTEAIYQACSSTLDYWTYTAESILGSSGSLTLDNYYSDTVSCKFILQGKSNSGILTVAIDKYDTPDNAIFEMDCSDPNDIDILIDWAAAVGYFLDAGSPSPNYIKTLITEAIDSGYTNIKNYYVAIDKNSDPIWKITIDK